MKCGRIAEEIWFVKLCAAGFVPFSICLESFRSPLGFFEALQERACASQYIIEKNLKCEIIR
jgi:hypothetical protein